VFSPFYSRTDNSSKSILNTLKTSYGGSREIIEKRVAVVKFGGNERISKNDSRIGIKRRASLSELTDLEEGRTTYIRNMGVEGQVRVKHDAKISYMGRRCEGIAMKSNRR
jgi:hypothetical protein